MRKKLRLQLLLEKEIDIIKVSLRKSHPRILSRSNKSRKLRRMRNVKM
jgi:hypothetical protein